MGEVQSIAMLKRTLVALFFYGYHSNQGIYFEVVDYGIC